MNLFMKLLIVLTRMVALWNFADGYRFAQSGQFVAASIKMALAAFMVYLEANYLVKGIEGKDSSKE